MARHGGGQAALALGALGVVFGDIGTSPLRAFVDMLHDRKPPLARVTAWLAVRSQ